MSVSIVMPCYNEEAVIERVIKDYYCEVIAKIDDSELIVIDDCSKDNTYNILNCLKDELPKLKILRTPINSGHGKAIALGYKSAEKEFVLQTDSDGQSESSDFWKLYSLKDDYDLILGFRKQRSDPVSRMIITKVLRLINFFLFGVWIIDVNCPFRLIRKTALIELLEPVDKEALTPNIMISIIAKKKNTRMIEVPITHYKRKTGQVSITNWKLIKFIIKVFWQLLVLKRCVKTPSEENL